VRLPYSPWIVSSLQIQGRIISKSRNFKNIVCVCKKHAWLDEHHAFADREGTDFIIIYRTSLNISFGHQAKREIPKPFLLPFLFWPKLNAMDHKARLTGITCSIHQAHLHHAINLVSEKFSNLNLHPHVLSHAWKPSIISSSCIW
jgi:hypothetical protein